MSQNISLKAMGLEPWAQKQAELVGELIHKDEQVSAVKEIKESVNKIRDTLNEMNGTHVEEERCIMELLDLIEEEVRVMEWHDLIEEEESLDSFD